MPLPPRRQEGRVRGPQEAVHVLLRPRGGLRVSCVLLNVCEFQTSHDWVCYHALVDSLDSLESVLGCSDPGMNDGYAGGSVQGESVTLIYSSFDSRTRSSLPGWLDTLHWIDTLDIYSIYAGCLLLANGSRRRNSRPIHFLQPNNIL